MVASMQRSAATGASETGSEFPNQVLWAVFAALAAAGAASAFVGFSRSGYWTDELFTLFVIDHDGGLGEVLRRALTDTHPPAYYFLLYEWSRLAGLSEAALRVSSAVCAVAAAGVFYVGLRGLFSRTARAFALAMSLNAGFWFQQSQNIRSYSLCMLISAALLVLALAARRQVRAGVRFPAWPCAGLFLAGLVGSFSHAYVFLEVGLVYLYLVLTVASTPLRVALVIWGAGLAGLDLVFVRTLLHSTLQDVHHMWFRNDPLFFFNQITVAYRVVYGISGVLAFIVLAVTARRRRRAGAIPQSGPVDPDRTWIVGLSVFGHLGMVVLGVAISLALAPSMSSINLATASPLLWTLMAWLYDLGGPRLAGGKGVALPAFLVLAAATHLPILPGRFWVRTEDWRGTARMVAAIPECAGKPIPVVLPHRFGPDTRFFRTLAERSFYGRYYPDPSRLRAYPAEAFVGPRRDPGLAALLAARASGADQCPVLAWAVHDLPPEDAAALRDRLARAPGVGPARVAMTSVLHESYEDSFYSRWPGAFIYRAIPALPPTAGPRRAP